MSGRDASAPDRGGVGLFWGAGRGPKVSERRVASLALGTLAAVCPMSEKAAVSESVVDSKGQPTGYDIGFTQLAIGGLEDEL